MNSPYKGKFRVSQQFKGSAHDGLDLVGVDSKNIYSTVDGVVEFAGWESALNHKKGFGRYIRIKKNNSIDKYYFGHLSSIKVKKGQAVKKGDLLGVEGSTGYSTGSHCHYCVRGNGSKNLIRDINKISEIPNKIGTYTDLDEKAPAKKTETAKYYKKYSGSSAQLDVVLKTVGVPSKYYGSWSKRKPLAKANGIKTYIGTAAQNNKLINLARQGKLKIV